jgi:hypothetical protein
MGGASGMRIDVTASATSENWPQEQCGEQPGVPLLTFSDGNGITGHGRFEDRLVIVDVGSKTVLIDVSAPAEKFDEFLPKVQKLLESVRWKQKLLESIGFWRA